MHPLRNGSQATDRPAAKPLTGDAGWFTESGDDNKPSYPGADWFNHVIAEFQNMLTSQGIAFDPENDDHLSEAFGFFSEKIDSIESDITPLKEKSKLSMYSGEFVKGDGSNETVEFIAMLEAAKFLGMIEILEPETFYNVTFPSSGEAEVIDKHTSGSYRWDGSRWIDVTPERAVYVIYVSASPGSGNLAVYPPIYDNLADAMLSITDNSKRRPYQIEMLSGVHDAREILLKDYVDIIRSPLSNSQVIIEHDFDKTESFKNRDIFKTSLTPYDATDNFPIRCKLKGLYVRGINLNYAIHGDFNSSPLLDIQADDCIFFNGDKASDALTADYGAGFGMYGRQRYVFNRCLFYGRYDATQIDKTLQQGSGWIVHNRLNQDGPCSVTFNDCKSLKGWYGGRIVDYASGHEDIVSINGGVLLGEFADLLCFSLAEAVTAPSLTVVGSGPVKSVRTTQETGSGTYECSFPIVISGFSEMYRADTALEAGDLVKFDVYQRGVGKASQGTRYRYKLGVVLNNAANGARVSVQEYGVAQVKFTPSSIGSNIEVSNSSTVDGEIQIATTGDGVIGSTISSTGFSSGETPDRAWISLDYAGTKA